MEIKTGATHYMSFPHDTSGLRRGDFTYLVFKDGELDITIAVDLVENPTNVYTFSFTNDGTHESHWSLIAWPTNDADLRYGESWIVRDDVPRKAVLDVQADVKQSGGGVGGSPGPTAGRS